MTTAVVGKLVGGRVERVEDGRILIGRGRYVDDVALPGMLHAAFVRSPLAHARITSIDTTEARALPGVVAVYTAADLEGLAKPLDFDFQIEGHRPPVHEALARDKVRFVGDPVALIVAETRYLAEDGCELVEVEYDELEPVTTTAQALAPDAPILFEELGDNVIHRDPDQAFVFGDVDGVFAARRPCRVGDIRAASPRARADGVPRRSGELRPRHAGAHVLRLDAVAPLVAHVPLATARRPAAPHARPLQGRGRRVRIQMVDLS